MPSVETLVGTPDPCGNCHGEGCGLCGVLPGPIGKANAEMEALEKLIRRFESGATRDTDEGKLDFEAYLSPLVLLRYAQYMQKHQTRSDGTKRAGDDWQAGMPKAEYMKSMLRHVFDVWLHYRNHGDMAREDLETALCAVIFNVMGYLFNELEGLD